MKLRLSAPEPLSADHNLSAFECGEASLDDWLKRRALANQLSGASRTFVVLDESRFVVAYYALAAGAVAHERATGGVRRNMPDPIPVLVLGRLAVAKRAQGLQLGAALLQDAVLRAMAVSENAGVRALLVHALNQSARDPLHNPGGPVAGGSGWAARRLFAANSPAIGKKSNAADRPSPTDHRPQGVMQRAPMAFYERYGFQGSPLDPMMLMLRLNEPNAAA